MELTFGQGFYQQMGKNVAGSIILSEHKLFLRGQRDDYPETYIPLEKIVGLKKVGKGVEIEVHLSLTNKYKAFISGQPKNISDLIAELVKKRNLKKKFLKKEWTE